jgi:actin-related protein
MASFPIPIPTSGGGKILGLPELITSAVGRCELDQQATLYNNLLLVGGGASFEGLTERLRAELDRLLAGTGGVGRVKILPPGQGVEKATAAWLGGSIVASLGGFHEMWISRREYEEYGPNIVDRKCP